MSAAYIFDVEGTLIDCVAETLQCWRATLRDFGVQVSSTDLQCLSGMDGDDMLATLAPRLNAKARKQILTAEGERYRNAYLPRVRPFPGVREVFSAIKASGGRIALATQCQGDQLQFYRGLLKTDDLIDVIACGEDVTKGKPDPALVERALDQLDTPAVFATMIGDTPFDAQAARGAGAVAWGTLGGGHTRSTLIDAGCSAVVSSVGDLSRFFQREKATVSLAASHRD